MGTKLHIFEFAFKFSSLLVGQLGTQTLMTPNEVDLNFTKGPKRN